MSVVRYGYIFKDEGEHIIPLDDGKFVALTDYERDCVKGRCVGCKQYIPNHRMFSPEKVCALTFRRKSPDNYCDEFAPKEIKP
jgi:hypothetical protein